MQPKPLASAEEMSPDQQATLKLVKERFEASEKLHRQHRDRWNVWYGLSRNYRRLQRQHAKANTPNDKDTVIQEFRRVFGEELFIPYIYTVIETNVPKVLANDPTILAMPNDPSPEAYLACDPVKRLFERDNKAMGYVQTSQQTARSGLRYGLGVQKEYWELKTRSGKKITAKESEAGFKFEDDKKIVVYEGPRAESIDIFDWFWDPQGHDLKTCDYIIHRSWRKMEYIEKKVAEGKQRRANGDEGGWVELDLQAVKGMGSDTARGEVWSERMQAAGMTNFDTEGNNLHEVWEYHDRENVYTILDRILVVQMAPNPFLHGDFPFQIYRPTLVEHELVGIGEAEPIAHLQYELNTMRGQRRDAATLAMNRGYFYSRGMLNPKSVVTGAGVFVPVTGDPKDAIFPMPFTDIPASGVSEEEALKRDIEMTTGISETVSGGGGTGDETATGRQLVQAAANLRVSQKAKNLFQEVFRVAVPQRRELYRQHLVVPNQSRMIRVEDPNATQEINGKTVPTGYSFVLCGPNEINANIDVEPADGSTEAENSAQKRADVIQLMQAITPFMAEVDQQKVVTYVLQQFGIDQPDSFIKPPGPKPEAIINAVGQALVEAGMPPEQVESVLQAAYSRLEQEPDPEQAEGGGEAPAAPPQAGG